MFGSYQNMYRKLADSIYISCHGLIRTHRNGSIHVEVICLGILILLISHCSFCLHLQLDSVVHHRKKKTSPATSLHPGDDL